MDKQDMSLQTSAEAASAVSGAVFKSAPPVTVAGLSLLGVPLQDWVYVLTLVWLTCQIVGWVADRVKRGKS